MFGDMIRSREQGFGRRERVAVKHLLHVERRTLRLKRLAGRLRSVQYALIVLSLAHGPLSRYLRRKADPAQCLSRPLRAPTVLLLLRIAYGGDYEQ